MARREFPDDLPVRERYDIVVVGGGLAGTCAAVAAARLGSHVALVQDRPVLGGAASSENQVPITGANTAGHALARYTRETGIVEEFMLENLTRNPLNSAWVRDVLWWELVQREPNLSLYLNAQAQEAVMASDTHIAGITVNQVSNESRYCLAGELFVDCSGDGRIAADAGAAFRVGREGRDEFGESMAPEQGDKGTLPSALLFRARRMDHPVPFEPPSWAYRYSTDEDLPFRPHELLIHGGSASTQEAPYSFWWVSCGGDWSTIDDIDRIHDTLLPVLMGVWDHLKNCGDHGVANYALEWISPMAIRRESRRFEGDLMVCQGDIMARRPFPDRVAYAGRAIDIHPPEGIFTSEPPFIFVELPYLWSVPFGALYSRNIENLLFAGRNISVSHVALGSTRVMSTCAVIGQAAGTAAHLCRCRGITPRSLRAEAIGALQQALLRQGCFIPGLRNEDPADLARTASLRASSEAAMSLQERPDGWASLDRPAAQLFPVSAPRIDSISLLIESSRDDAVELTLGLRRATDVNDFYAGVDLTHARATVPPAGRHWVTFDFRVDVEAGGLYWVWLPATDGLRWAEQRVAPLGSNRARYGQLGERERAHWGDRAPVWFSERGAFLFQLSPSSHPYGAANVINGVTRPEAWPNAWLSDPARHFPQWIDLDLGAEQIISTVILTFDSELDASIRRQPPNGIFGCGAVPELVRDYALYARRDRGWQRVLSVEGNYQRRREHRFEPVSTDCLRVEVRATNGASQARIYEVRVYGGETPCTPSQG